MSDITIRPDDIGTPDVSIKVNVAGGMDGVGIEDITITGGAETDNDGPGGGTGGGTGGGITHETDPTVPAWAKQPKKPTYTAEEVGGDDGTDDEQQDRSDQDLLVLQELNSFTVGKRIRQIHIESGQFIQRISRRNIVVFQQRIYFLQ